MDYLENNQNHTNLPELCESVTMQLVPKFHQESVIISTEAARNMLMEAQEAADEDYEKLEQDSENMTGVHFLTDDECPNENYEKKKHELLEYITRDDGSVVCKLCGELLASRTHWYRHKYKFHVTNLVNPPAPLFKCKLCNVFFKSRKGYTGHIASRHTEICETPEEIKITIKEEELEVFDVPKLAKKKDAKNADWEEQRIKEEKLVAAIIDRVRKECEAQGGAVTRRGYSRRNTVMMNTS